MAHEELNTGKFYDCLTKYRANAGRTNWSRNELRKFYFANSLTWRIDLATQSAAEILEICGDVKIETLNFEFCPTVLHGTRFTRVVGELGFANMLSENDAGVIKRLAAVPFWNERDFADRSLSFTALSSWLGTLLPSRFMPVPSTQFRHSISYLFDLELKLHQADDFEFFKHAQKYFYKTKTALKGEELASIYLPEIAESLKTGPHAHRKTKLEEVDLNWLTQDFHLFVVREILGLGGNDRFPLLDKRRRTARTELLRVGLPVSV